MPSPDKIAAELRTLSSAEITDREYEFLQIAADVPGEYWTRTHLLHELPEKWRLSFAAWRGDDPIGYAILSRKSASRIHLHHFMIERTQRGKGLGGRMVGEMIARSASAGARRLTLKAKDTRVRRFYRRHGFSEFGEDGCYALLERTFSNPTT